MSITYRSVVDLSHTLRPGIPLWPGDPEPSLESVASIEREGFYQQQLTTCEHTGTHFGSAAHLDPSGAFADRLSPESFIRPAVVIDAREACAADAGYRLAVADVMRWEEVHGRVPVGSVMLLCTGWSNHWSEPMRYAGMTDESSTMRYPGYSLDAARMLADERGVVGLGIDTLGIDAGEDEELSVNRFWLRGERFHLENLTRLERLPATGAMLFIGVMKIAHSSGGPARVLALF